MPPPSLLAAMASRVQATAIAVQLEAETVDLLQCFGNECGR